MFYNDDTVSESFRARRPMINDVCLLSFLFCGEHGGAELQE